MKTRTAFYLFVLACLVVLAGCRGAASPVTPSLAVPVASATPTVQPSLTATSLPSLASTLTFTPNPTTTPRPPSPTPTSTFTPTPTYAFTRIGTPLPALEVISPENAGRLVQVARWGKGAVRLLQYAPDGKSLAVATSEGVYFYDANTLELLQFNPFPIQGEPLAFTHNLERLFTTGPGLIIRVWDSTTGELVQSLSQPIEGYDSIRSAALPNDELVIFTPQGDRLVHSFTWDLKTDQVTETAYPGAATYKVSADGSTIFAHRLSDLFFVSWHISDLAASPAVIREYPLTVDPLLVSSAISADGKEVMVGLYDTLEIRIWRVSDGELLKDFSINPYNSRGQGGVLQSQRMRSGPGNFVVKDMAFSPDGKKLAFSTGFDIVYQYDRESNKVLTISEAVGTLPNAVLYSPDGNRLVNIGGTAQFYNTQNGRVIGWLSDHFAGIFDLEFQPGGNLIALACDDGHVWLRSNQDGSAVNALPKPRLSPEELGSDGSQRISDLDFSLDGQQIIFGSYDTSIWLWDLKHGARLVTYANDTVEQVAMSPDGKTIAYIYYDGYMDILNTSTGAIINWTYPFDVAFHPSGEFIIMANAGIIQTYFLGGSYADEFTKDSGHIRISPSGNLLAVGGSEHVNIYRIADKSLVWEFLHPLLTSPNSLDDVKALDFSPDERLLAVSTETEIYILDLTNGQLLATLEGESTSVSFSSDGKLLASGDYAGIVSIWAVPQVP